MRHKNSILELKDSIVLLKNCTDSQLHLTAAEAAMISAGKAKVYLTNDAELGSSAGGVVKVVGPTVKINP